MKDTLLILTPGFPVDEADTTCLPPQQVFIRALQKEFPKLDIVVVSFEYPYKKEYRWNGLEVFSFGSKRNGLLFKLMQRLRIKKVLKKMAGEKRLIGILSFWCGKCAVAGKRVAQQYNLIHYCWILGQDAKKGNKYIKYMKPKANELIALSDFIADEFEKNYSVRPAHIIPPGVEPDSFRKKQPLKDIDILGAGSLIPLKQYSIFIKQIADLKKQLPGIKAVLSGKGPEKEKLELLIIQYGLQNNITLTGELSHADIVELMQRTKVFLHPSSYEGFGVVCIESLYAGAAVISFCQPMKEKVKNWHIVNSEEEMTVTALQLLKTQATESVSSFIIKDTAIAMMRLYNYKEATTR